jgi:hypothetical protein
MISVVAGACSLLASLPIYFAANQVGSCFGGGHPATSAPWWGPAAGGVLLLMTIAAVGLGAHALSRRAEDSRIYKTALLGLVLGSVGLVCCWPTASIAGGLRQAYPCV